jgi:transcriptional regulator with PAS, ATPase and Fis domain
MRVPSPTKKAHGSSKKAKSRRHFANPKAEKNALEPRDQQEIRQADMSGEIMNDEIIVSVKHRDPTIEVIPTLEKTALRGERKVFFVHSNLHKSAAPGVDDGANGAVAKVVERKWLERESEAFAERVDSRYHMVVGKSPQIHDALSIARKAAPSRSTILLLGESGTGKEIFARAIHNWSDRKDKPFVAINCVGLSRELLESQLFGHEKGAFTGALELKKGKMELAHGGTVFLDEVGDISTELQTKLLRFLQEREFERVGGTTSIRVDLRIIAATNRDLYQDVREGHFREDLYYRLNVVPLSLPPLRERKEDIPALATYLLKRSTLETKKNFTGITEEALQKLIAYRWPGNVRELANVIESAVVLGRGPELTVHDLPDAVVSTVPTALPEGFSYHQAIDAYRRELIAKTLAQTRGNRAAAAKLLGLQRTYLSRLMRALRVS